MQLLADSNAGCRDGWLRPALVSLRPPDEGERHQQEKHDILFLYAYKVFCVHFHGSNIAWEHEQFLRFRVTVLSLWNCPHLLNFWKVLVVCMTIGFQIQ